MKTLSSPITTQKDAAESGWCEVFDIYLKSAISTPWGSVSTLRLTNLPGGLAFFTPTVDPESAGTQGDAQDYNYWPIKRDPITGQTKSADDQFQFTASNVTLDWAAMVAAIDWQGTPVVVRLISTTIAAPTNADCVILFNGIIEQAAGNNEALQFTCSTNLGDFTLSLPRENMHRNCRTRWASDLCTRLRFLPANYKAKTAGSNCTTTRVFSSNFTEDAAANRYSGQAVTADSTTDKISLTGHNLNNGDTVRFGGTAVPTGLTAGTTYYVVSKAANDFKVAATYGGSAIDLTSNGTSVTMDSDALYGPDLIDALADGNITDSSHQTSYAGQAVTVDGVSQGLHGSTSPVVRVNLTNHQLVDGDMITFAGSPLPGGIAGATTYYVVANTANSFLISSTLDLANLVVYSSSGTSVTISTVGDYLSKNVRASNSGYWKIDPGGTDWGTYANGYWQIPDAQAGLANGALKPYIQFDFGSAKQPKVWRIKTPDGLAFNQLVRTILIFSSSDASTWHHETYAELPPRGGTLFDILNPTASSARYWRICVRNGWGINFGTMFDEIRAYELARHWWAFGRIRFDAATATVALRNITRKLIESYSGEIVCKALPAAPANGDTFVVERGCSRTFNACCERQNWENFAGFLELPDQTVIR